MALFGNRIAQERIDQIVSFIENWQEGDGNVNLSAGDDAVAPIVQALQQLKARQCASAANCKNELEDIVRNVLDGNLARRAVTEGVPRGELRSAYEGINAILDAISGPLILTSNYIDQIAQGVIPEIIQTEYQGEYRVIRDNLNELILRMRDLSDQTKTQLQGAAE